MSRRRSPCEHRQGRVLRALLAVCLLLVGSPVLGQAPAPKPAQLEYLRGGLTACPKESFFHTFVAGRFRGDDPFQAQAARRIRLTLRRDPKTFAADVDMYDQAGTYLGGKKLAEADCTDLVESAGLLVVSWLVPLTGPAQPPERVEEHAEPALPPPPVTPPRVEPKPGALEPLALAAPPAPAVEPRAGALQGKAGVACAVLYGLTAGGLAMGSAFVLAANNKIDGARNLLSAAQQKGGASPCAGSAPAGSCQQIADLVEQHDRYTDGAIGSFIAAGVLAGVATASIWIPHSPAAPALHVTPSAARSGGGMALQGSW
jgi:hypothetical protein